MATSACGVCGKDSIEAIRVRSAFDVAADRVQVSPAVLAGLPVEAVVGLEVSGPGGGRWSFRLDGGAVRELRRDGRPDVEVVYRTDAATFAAVVEGRETAHDAFLDRRLDVAGDVEKGLKLAVLFARFVEEFAPPPRDREEIEDDAALHL